MKYHYTDSGKFSASDVIKVESIRFEWKPDCDTSPDEYAQDYADCEPDDRAKYLAQDAERMAAYRRDEWNYQGCIAIAVVSRPIGQGSRRLQEFTSGGLWGIESDSDADYLRSVERDELADLAAHLKAFGIEMPANIKS